MSAVQQHYDALLGPVYSWMLGDMSAALAGARAQLQELGVPALAPGVAVDLGAGPGVHAIPLAEMGFSVLAIDSCAALLDEISHHAADTPVVRITDDLTRFRSHLKGRAKVILCMTDTLTHLPTRAVVDQLCEDVAAALEPAGMFIATFRDYSGKAPEGSARFIPVRSDTDRILTCFLEYGDTHVTVHDLLHEREASGWKLKVSAYPKLRLAPGAIQARFESLGLRATLSAGPRGMVCLVAVAPQGS
jgi:hypothetical protein